MLVVAVVAQMMEAQEQAVLAALAVAVMVAFGMAQVLLPLNLADQIQVAVVVVV
jgi:hypothetical protein